jgi:hypothetical protein
MTWEILVAEWTMVAVFVGPDAIPKTFKSGVSSKSILSSLDGKPLRKLLFDSGKR